MVTGVTAKSIFGRNIQLVLNPRRPQQHAFLVFERIGEVDDVAAGFARHLPRIAGKGLIGSKEREVHVVQVLRQHALDEGRLLAYRLQLAERFVVVEQADILSRKVAVAEDVLQLAALQRGGAYDGYAEHSTPVAAFGTSSGGVVWFMFHQACNTSSRGGGGGTAGRRKTKESRARTPERM